MVAIATLRSGLSAEQLEGLRRLAEQIGSEEGGPDGPQGTPDGQTGTGLVGIGGADGPQGHVGAGLPGAEGARRPADGSLPGTPGAPGARPSRAGRPRPVNRMAPVGPTVQAEAASGAMPELPGFVVTCWSCGEAFPLRRLAGTRSARSCPLCGAPLHESLYDRRAAEVLASAELREFREAREGVRAVEARREENRARRLGLRRLAEALRVWRDGRRARRRFKAASPEGLRAEQRLFSLARARYFTGRWYLDTRAELSAPQAGGLEGYRLEAAYGEDGAFRLERLDAGSESVGMVGEFEAFEQVRRGLEGARGPLEGAALLADLYLPRGAFGEGGRHRRWSQVDQVVVTTRAVLVVEVKSARRAVRVSGDFEHLATAGGSRSRSRRRPYDKPLRQVEGHARALEQLLSTIPRDRFFRAVAFVGEGRVEGGPEGFRDHAFVGSLRDGGDALLGPFAEAIRGLEPFTSPSGVMAIARELQRYADPTHVKQVEHVDDLAASGRTSRAR